MTATLTLGLASETGKISNANLQSAVTSTLATPTEARTYLGQHVQLGVSKLIGADDSKFRLDRFTPPNSLLRNFEPDYHPELPNAMRLEMTQYGRRQST